MRIVLDTNVLLRWVRNDTTWKRLQKEFALFDTSNELIVSAVTVGELSALARRHQWGEKKMDDLEVLLQTLIIVDVNYSDILEIYADLDAFSGLPARLSNRIGPAISVGKNDLWIAATAVITDSVLITSDADFDHFNGVYFDVLKYSQLKV